MSSRLRHGVYVHRDGAVDLTIAPNDGRHPEVFRVTPAELRRFAWAVLSDFDPAEAAVAAAEDGRDLDGLAREPGAPHRRRCAGPGAAGAPPPAGSKKRRILELLCDGAHTVEAIAGRLPDVANPSALLYELRGGGFVARSSDRQRLWILTEDGRCVISQPRAGAA